MDAYVKLYDYGARFYDPALGRFVSADTVVPNPMNPQEFNRYAYCLSNPLRYVDPTGYYSEQQIKDYLINTYGDNWEAYWKAWQADPYWMWALSQADNGFSMSTEGAGTLLFEENGSTFTIKSAGSGKTLANWQGTGRYILHTPGGERVNDLWGGHLAGQEGLFGWVFYHANDARSVRGVYEPIYDYSSGVPKFTGKWLYLATQREVVGINPAFSDDTPWVALAASKLAEVGAVASGNPVVIVAAELASKGVMIWTAATLIDNLFVSQDRYVSDVYNDPRSKVAGNGPVPLYLPNPNGLGYSQPVMP